VVVPHVICDATEAMHALQERLGSAEAAEDLRAGERSVDTNTRGHSSPEAQELVRGRAVLLKPASILHSAQHLNEAAVQLCKECFYAALEEEVHNTIMRYNLFKPGEVVAIGASGGKDSTVLAHMMCLLNKRHKCAF
jgi:hypothetical protein